MFLKNRYRKVRGFTLLELMFVIAILAIIVSLFMMNYRKSLEYQKFNTSFHQVAALIKRAQTEAVAHGKNPEGFVAFESSNNDMTRKYVVYLVNNKETEISQKMWSRIQCSELEMHFNFDSQPLSSEDLKNTFVGVAVFFGRESEDGNYTGDMMLYFGPNGVPIIPEGGGTGPDADETDFIIQMTLRNRNGDPERSHRILIDRLTGSIRIEENVPDWS